MPVFSKPVLFPHSNVIVSWNCNGMQSKLDHIITYLASYQPLLLILQETHPNSILSHLTHLKPTLNDYINIENYTCVHAPHPSLSDTVVPPSSALLKKKSFNRSTFLSSHSSSSQSRPSLSASSPFSPPSSSTSTLSSINSAENDINNIDVIDSDEDENDPNSASQHYDGICYLIRNDINFTIDCPSLRPFSTSSINSSQVHFIHLLSINLIVGSVYFHPSSSRISLEPITSKITAFLSHCSSSHTPFLLIGDMNAHHPRWALNQQANSNAAGNYIESLLSPLSSSPLSLLNEIHCAGIPTFQRQSNNQSVQSLIDLALTSIDNSIIDRLEIDSSCILPSDHHPLLIHLNNDPHSSQPLLPSTNSNDINNSDDPVTRRIKFRYMNAPTSKSSSHYKEKYKHKWEAFRPHLSSLLSSKWLSKYNSSTLTNTTTIDDAAILLSEVITEAATDVFGENNITHKHNYWFHDQQIQSAISQ
jgi:exonuclease III